MLLSHEPNNWYPEPQGLRQNSFFEGGSMSTTRFVRMKLLPCVRGCGHMARGGDHGTRKVELRKDLDYENAEFEQVLRNHGLVAVDEVPGPGEPFVENGNIVLPNCPPKRGIYGEHRRKTKARKRRARREAQFHVARGTAIAGVHKVSASSDRSRTSKKTAEK